MTDEPSAGGEVDAGLVVQAQRYSEAYTGSLHRQHNAASQLAASEVARQAVQIAEQASVIEALQAEVVRLTKLTGAAIPKGDDRPK